MVTRCFLFLGEYFEILTDFSSLGISFFFLASLRPRELGFSVQWPQGRAESRAKQSRVRALESEPPGPQGSRKDSCAEAVNLGEYLWRELLSLETRLQRGEK